MREIESHYWNATVITAAGKNGIHQWMAFWTQAYLEIAIVSPDLKLGAIIM